jgi:hypothetical protein
VANKIEGTETSPQARREAAKAAKAANAEAPKQPHSRARTAETAAAKEAPVWQKNKATAAAAELAQVGSSGQGQDASKGEAAAVAAGTTSGDMAAAAARVKGKRSFRRHAFKVLYFIRGAVPTQDDLDEAQAIGPNVMMRNVGKIVPGAPLENCDAVAGFVPPDYAKVYPVAGKDHQVAGDGSDRPEGVMVRPRRTSDGSMAPDNVRPGTIDDGIAHASGTGADKPGINFADPSQNTALETPNTISETRKAAAEWKANKSASG